MRALPAEAEVAAVIVYIHAAPGCEQKSGLMILTGLQATELV
jgi:hypothetical protein